jgi:hypothetical protein
VRLLFCRRRLPRRATIRGLALGQGTDASQRHMMLLFVWLLFVWLVLLMFLCVLMSCAAWLKCAIKQLWLFPKLDKRGGKFTRARLL